MNVHDEEFVPPATNPELLRRLKAEVRSIVVPGDIHRVRNTILGENEGVVPHEMRGTIWLYLLGLSPDQVLAQEDPNSFAAAAKASVNDENSKDQIWKDVRRTRPTLQRFREERVRNALVRLLSLFCHRNKITYIQGLNEILAPFILLPDAGGNPRLVYGLFNGFVARFASFLLDDFEQSMFATLKVAFSFFGRLLLYHDPELFWYLENRGMSVNLYTTSWFITVFARNFSLETLLYLWDLLLLEDHALGIYFFGLALVLDKRNELLSIDASHLPETLMNLAPHTASEVKRLWRWGSELRTKKTPSSYLRIILRKLLPRNLTASESVNQSAATNYAVAAQADTLIDAALEQMRCSCCLQVSLEDATLTRTGQMSSLIWDCRTLPEFEAGHFAQAALLPLDGLRSAVPGKIKEDLDNILRICEPIKGQVRICLVGSGITELDNQDVYQLALLLTQAGIPYVCLLLGGFKNAIETGQRETPSFLDEYNIVDFDANAYRSTMELRQKGKNQSVARASSTAIGGIKSPTAASAAANAARNSFVLETPSYVMVAPSLEYDVIPLRRKLEIPRAEIAPAPSGKKEKEKDKDKDKKKEKDKDKEKDKEKEEDKDDRKSSSKASTTIAGASAGSNNATPSNSSMSLSEMAPSNTEDGEGKREPSWFVRKLTRHGSQEASHKYDDRVLESQSSNSSLMSLNHEPPLIITPVLWAKSAEPGWLNEETLSRPVNGIPSGFTVNVSRPDVMSGLRLFPCRARYEIGSDIVNGGGSSKSSKDKDKGSANGSASRKVLVSKELRRLYVGISKYFFLLLAPHKTRPELLELELIRHLSDVGRISFKKSQPDLVSFYLVTQYVYYQTDKKGTGFKPGSNGKLTEGVDHVLIVCEMKDSIQECAELIKRYLES